jgi:hypothetical protein
MSGPRGHSAGSQWSHRWRSGAKADAAQGCFGGDGRVGGILTLLNLIFGYTLAKLST